MPDKLQQLVIRPQAFELCSRHHARTLFAGRALTNPDLALPVTPIAWRRLHNLRLASEPTTATTPTTEPWWLDIDDSGTANDKATALFYVAPGLPCFLGHFPGQPILPGVMQLEWAVGLAHRLWPDQLPARGFAGMSRVKFKTPIEPGAVLAMELALFLQPEKPAIALTIRSAEQTHTSARLLYRD